MRVNLQFGPIAEKGAIPFQEKRQNKVKLICSGFSNTCNQTNYKTSFLRGF